VSKSAPRARCLDRGTLAIRLNANWSVPLGSPQTAACRAARLRGDVMRVVAETGGLVRQRQAEVGDVDARLAQSIIVTRSAVMLMLPERGSDSGSAGVWECQQPFSGFGCGLGVP